MLYDKRAVSLKDKLIEKDRETKALAEKEVGAKENKKEKVEVTKTKKK